MNREPISRQSGIEEEDPRGAFENGERQERVEEEARRLGGLHRAILEVHDGVR